MQMKNMGMENLPAINEWLDEEQRDAYWPYVVRNPADDDCGIIAIPDPSNKLEHAAEVGAVGHYEIGKISKREGYAI